MPPTMTEPPSVHRASRANPLDDALHQLGEAVATLALDATLREGMSKEARRKAEADFDQKQVIEIVLDAYDRLLAEKDLKV